METEIISARNIVELLMREEFDASICKSSSPQEGEGVAEDKGDDFVYGWDC